MDAIQTIEKGLFWTSAVVIVYVYVGYPLAMLLLARRPIRARAGGTKLPPVSLIISAYNERQIIAAKIENALSLDYPKHLFEIFVISDCSDDGTDDIVRKFSDRGIQLVRQTQRLGKTSGLNLGVPQTSGEILVFSDANALYRPDAILQLVRHFADPKVGYVVGNARYIEDPNLSMAGKSEGLYWKLETWLKAQESRFHSVVGGDGAIYAIRRGLYTPMLATDINDFLTPLQIVNRGYMGVFEPAAVSYERGAGTFKQEFRRKTRIVSRSLRAVAREPGVLNPLRNGRHWFMLLSHKLLRWFVPFFMIVLLATSLLLWSFPFYRAAAIVQVGLYVLALLGGLWPESVPAWKLLYLPYYFFVVNLAALAGVYKYFRGELEGTWMPARSDGPSPPFVEDSRPTRGGPVAPI